MKKLKKTVTPQLITTHKIYPQLASTIFFHWSGDQTQQIERMLSTNLTEKAYLHVFEADCGEAYQYTERSKPSRCGLT